MDFSIAPSTQQMLDTFRDLVRLDVEPLEADFLAQPFRELLPKLSRVRELARQRGLWAPHVPRHAGGSGLNFMQLALAGQQLGWSPLGHYAVNYQAPDAGNMELLLEFGTTQQQQRWLQPLVQGDIRSAFAMTEPDRAGSNPVWMDTTAVRDGSGYVINGRKWFVSGADGAALTIVMAVTDPDAGPHRRASMLLIPTDAPGYRLVRNIPHMGHTGQDWSSHGEVAFEDCRVDADHLLGEPGAGFAMAQARLGPGRIHHAMRWIGICERAFDLMCRRAAARQIAPGQPLASQQAIQHSIAESRADIDAARLMVLHTAWKIDQMGIREARIDISLVKFFVARTLTTVLDRAIQAHGALGVSDDLILAMFYRSERAARIYDGPDEVHKTVVARRMLRDYVPPAKK